MGTPGGGQEAHAHAGVKEKSGGNQVGRWRESDGERNSGLELEGGRRGQADRVEAKAKWRDAELMETEWMETGRMEADQRDEGGREDGSRMGGTNASG